MGWTRACPVGRHPVLAFRKLRVKLVKRYVVLHSYEEGQAIISRVFHTLQDYARIIARED